MSLRERAAVKDARVHRRLPVGAELHRERGASFRVWAPHHSRVSVVFEGAPNVPDREVVLLAESDGYFSGLASFASAGMLYRYRLGSDDSLFPDPASRFQPQGPHGPSEIVDPSLFHWTDAAWMGVTISSQVLYEIHIGTFTGPGTWQSALEQLPHLARLGITTIEVMPVAEFPGRFGWGYDGVDLYAPFHGYGRPDDFRQFVDRAHALGMGVILDVVYNHFGPDGNYLRAFAPEYFSTRNDTEWGDALNFDGEHAGPVREFMIENAGYWIDEFHLDGLRLDATQQIFDDSEEHVMSALARRAREAAGSRTIIVVAENEPQDASIVRPIDQGGKGLDGLWNDDFHHAATVALTGRREGYFTDYMGSPQEFISMAKWGFLYQGQWYSWQRKPRGTSSRGIEPERFVTFLQNHDQIANGVGGRGERLDQIASPGALRAITAYWLLAPGTPMLFQGQEFCASSPFLYFADHAGDLGAAVRKGRAEFMSQFRSLAVQDLEAFLPDPGSERTFLQCKLRADERQTRHAAIALHRDLLKLRRDDPVLRAPQSGSLDGAVLGPHTFVLRFFAANLGRSTNDHGDRLVIVNLGLDLHFDPAPEPLLAPPAGSRWAILWSSEDPAYGGTIAPPLDIHENWRFPGHATVVLAPSRDA